MDSEEKEKDFAKAAEMERIWTGCQSWKSG